jgi:Pentapeptide repeats (8 copies)
MNQVTASDRTGIMCEVSDSQAPSARPTAALPPEPRIHLWSRASPWLGGLLLLLLLAAIASTQVSRISQVFSGHRGKSAEAARTQVPALSGPTYTQPMVARIDFSHADLRGAVLRYLDLRGRDFYRADAAGAFFAGSLLNGADFSRADLRGADLSDACLRGADLNGADLAGANFTGADVTGATVTPAATGTAISWGSIAPASACRRN